MLSFGVGTILNFVVSKNFLWSLMWGSQVCVQAFYMSSTRVSMKDLIDKIKAIVSYLQVKCD